MKFLLLQAGCQLIRNGKLIADTFFIIFSFSAPAPISHKETVELLVPLQSFFSNKFSRDPNPLLPEIEDKSQAPIPNLKTSILWHV